MNRYTGVTIGPIFETINMAGSPAALWAASYMFSSISKAVCEALVDSGVPEEDIIAPYYKKDDPLLEKDNGIGLFHDRIIFRSDSFDIADFTKIRESVLRKTAQMFGVSYEYLDEYILLSAAEFEAENPITGSGSVLDCIELSTPYVFCEKSNPLISLFTNDDEKAQQSGRNEAIKQLSAGMEEFQLRESETSLKKIEDIVNTGTGGKKFKYYAIVRSDGDNTHKIMETLDAEHQREFSRECLNHCARVAGLVKSFDGVTIYSGGDDLLAILPCESRLGEKVLEFARRANEMYVENFRKYNVQTTLSFGIAIAYYKYPLSEALAESAHLLFGIAKTKKNGVALSVRKHSGQTDSVFVSNNRITEFINLQKSATEPVKEGDIPIVLSTANDMAKYNTLFEQCTDETDIKNLFCNLFPASNKEFWHKKVPEMYVKLKNGMEIEAITETGITKGDAVQALVYMIRIINFFAERDGGI